MEFAPEANVPLASLTTWRIGGPAEWYCSPKDEERLTSALAWAATRKLPVRLLGRGSNVLIADAGLRGLVISLRDFERKQETVTTASDGEVLTVGAGLSLPRLAKLVAARGYGGYEFYIGIPGSVGGAVAMNAGFGPGDERHTANRCLEVQTLTPEGLQPWRPYGDFHPVYRHTDLLDNGQIILRARFALLRKASPEEIRSATAEHLAMRKAKQPLTRPTAGSVFKGTEAGVPAAVYIDRCGLKGLRVGGAVVSPKHANWIENAGGATAADVLTLIERIRETVAREEGVTLEPEVRFLH